MTAIVISRARPCRQLPTMRPNANTKATGRTSWLQFCNMFDQTLGFSKGCAELALKKPPPLSPTSLIASWLATGPSAMTCFAPSSVVASTEALSVCGTPSAAKASATTIDSGRST